MAACSEPDCTRPHRALGKCDPHYRQFKRMGTCGPVRRKREVIRPKVVGLMRDRKPRTTAMVARELGLNPNTVGVVLTKLKAEKLLTSRPVRTPKGQHALWRWDLV